MTNPGGMGVPDTSAAEKLAAEMEAQAEASRARMGQLRNHMLDVVDALREIQATADSDELGLEDGDSDGSGAGDRRGARPGIGPETGGERQPLVSATVNGEGALIGLRFSDAAMRTSHREIERLVVAVAGRAAVKAAMAHAEVMRRSGFVRGDVDER